MWQILKAEISYHKFILLVAFAVLMVFFVVSISDDEQLKWRSWLPQMIFIFTMSSAQKGKRQRLFILLPIPIAKVAFARIMFLYLVFLSMSMFWMPQLFSQYDILQDKSAWVIIAAGTLLLFAYAFVFIVHDLKSIQEKSYRMAAIVLAIGYSALLALMFALVLAYQDSAQVPYVIALLQDLPIILAWCILPIPLLFFTSSATFIRRKSYLDGRTVCG
ncbi:MAG: hypothetical protein ACE5I1_09055 [bacterium]